GDTLPDFPAVFAHRLRAHERSILSPLHFLSHVRRLALVLGVHRQKRIHIRTSDWKILGRSLVRASKREAVCGANHPRRGLQACHDGDRQRGTKSQSAAYVEAVGMTAGNRLFDGAIQALKSPEQRKSDDDLRENEKGATRLAPDSGPHQW